jgi:hypothetical protein
VADLAAAGTIGEPFEVRIDAGKIEELARALGSEHPAYRGADAVAPPTFLTVQNFWEKWAGPAADPWQGVGLDPERELHAGQEFVFHGPPPSAGMVLSARSRIESVRAKTGRDGGEMVFAVMVTEYRDESGRLVAEATCTGVETPPSTDGGTS